MVCYHSCVARQVELGAKSRAHVLLTSDTDKISDSALRAFCSDKENCLRTTMIMSLGDSVRQDCRCCMICNPAVFDSAGDERLGFLDRVRTLSRKKRRVAVRRVTELLQSGLESSLKAERASYIMEHPSLAILGKQLTLP